MGYLDAGQIESIGPEELKTMDAKSIEALSTGEQGVLAGRA